MKTFARLWKEEAGAILSAEVMMVASILVIGVIAGLSSLRDAVVSELADVAQALANVNQTYSFGGVAGHHVFNGGGAFIDLSDFCDTTAQTGGSQTSKCVTICSTPINGGVAASTDGLEGN